jgi:site-specific recombinase XerD
LLDFPEEPALSVTLHLQEYLQRTNSYRGEHTQLLLSYVKLFKPVSKATLSRWIKEVLKSAGIDTEKYAPHSTRAASTSKCRSKGLQMDEIMKTAGRINAGTFARFYGKPVET